jgi:hypothetical protein
MKSLIALSAVAAIGAVAAPAFAQTLPALGPVTYNASVGYTGIDTSGADLGAVSLRAGADFGKYLGAEAEGAFGVNDQRGKLSGAVSQLHLNSEYAAYGVARWPVLANANLFARIGYGHSDVRATGANNAAVNDGLDSWNYGVGGEYFFDGQNGVRVDYTRFNFQDRGLQDANTWSVGYVRHF